MQHQPRLLLCCVCQEKNTTFRYEVVCRQDSNSIALLEVTGHDELLTRGVSGELIVTNCEREGFREILLSLTVKGKVSGRFYCLLSRNMTLLRFIKNVLCIGSLLHNCDSINLLNMSILCFN